MQVNKQQLEPDMEQWTGSKLGKEYVKAIYCHLAYLTYMQSTSCEMLDWVKHKLESKLPGEILLTSDRQMTPFLWQKVKRNWKSESEVAQLCLTLCDPMDCSLPGSSIHGIFQARVLEWVAISFSRGSSQPSNRTWVSTLQAYAFPSEPPGKPWKWKRVKKLA